MGLAWTCPAHTTPPTPTPASQTGAPQRIILPHGSKTAQFCCSEAEQQLWLVPVGASQELCRVRSDSLTSLGFLRAACWRKQDRTRGVHAWGPRTAPRATPCVHHSSLAWSGPRLRLRLVMSPTPAPRANARTPRARALQPLRSPAPRGLLGPPVQKREALGVGVPVRKSIRGKGGSGGTVARHGEEGPPEAGEREATCLLTQGCVEWGSPASISSRSALIAGTRC